MSDNVALRYHDVVSYKLQRSHLRNWTGWDIVVANLTSVASLMMFYLMHPMLAILVAFCLMSLNVRVTYDRLYAEIAYGLLGSYQSVVLKGVLWRANDTDSWLIRLLRSRRLHFIRRHRRAVIPLSINIVEAQGEQFAILRQNDRGLDHMFVAADGSHLAALNHARQDEAVRELADALNQVAAQSLLPVGISYLRVTRPMDASKMNDFFGEAVTPLVAYPEKFALDEDTEAVMKWLRQNVSQLESTARTYGAAQNWLVAVISIKSRDWRGAQRGKLDDQGLYDLQVIRLANSLMEAMRSAPHMGLSNVRCYGYSELCSLIRASWDLKNVQSFYQQRSAGLLPSPGAYLPRVTAEDIQDENSSYTAKDLGLVKVKVPIWPTEEISVGKDYVCMDGTYISTLRIVRQPQRLRVDQMQALHHKPRAGRWTTMALTGETISGVLETHTMIVGESAAANIQSALFSRRVVTNPYASKRRDQLRQAKDTFSGASRAQQYNILYSVSATSLEELRAERRNIKAALDANGFHAKAITGHSRQIDAMTSSLLGVNRL